MNTLLIFPKREPFDKKKTYLKTYGPVPPLGICYLAAVLRKENMPVRLIDCHISSPEELKEAIGWADIVGISTPTVYAQASLEIAEYAKSLDKIVIIGGPQATLDPEYFLHHNYVDYVLRGESEYNLPRLLKSIRNKTKEQIGGLAYRNGNNDIHSNPTSLVSNLDELPLPARDLLPIQNYYPFNKGIITMITSRGCPYQCIYCAKEIAGLKYRIRNPKLVVDEIEEIVTKYKPHHIRFNEDIFLLDKKRVIEICNEIVRRNLKLNWSCDGRADCIDEEIIISIKRAGCTSVSMGAETGSQRILDYLNKKITVEQTKRATKIIKKHNLKVHHYIIIGTPIETLEDIEKTKQLIKETRPTSISVTLFSPFAGTKSWELLKDDLVLGDLSEMDFFTKLSFKHKNFTEEELLKIKQDLLDIQRKNKLKNSVNHFIHPFFTMRKIFELIKFRHFLKTIIENKNFSD
ncbi:MAG: radical SAM protein [Candidatus Woesearchaeota archaeon]